MKINTLKTVLIITLSIILNSCSSSTKENSINQVKDSESSVHKDTVSKNIFGIVKGQKTVIRTGPGIKYSKVVNQNATELLHETQYAIVDNSTRVIEKENIDGWSLIEVVDPRYLSDSHKGWIESKFLFKEVIEDQSLTKVKKVSIFNDVLDLQREMSEIGIGALRPWHNDGESWISSTPYFSIGSPNTENGLQNNFACYLESQTETSVDNIKIVLNVNNKSEQSQARLLLGNIVQKTFKSLQLKPPKSLLSAIKSGQSYVFQNTDYTVSLKIEKSNIDTWELTIEPKYRLSDGKVKYEVIKIKRAKVFNDVQSLQKILSNNGIGTLMPWHNDGSSWVSSTASYSIGLPDSGNGLQNNIAYFLESQIESSIDAIKILLNVNNKSEKSKAILFLDEITHKTFLSLKLKIPKGLSEAINSEEFYVFQNQDFAVSLMLETNKTETLQVTIEPK